MALDCEETQDTLFGGLNKEKEVFKPSTSSKDTQPLLMQEALQKWETMDKVTACLLPGQKEWLDGMAKKIMRSRAKNSSVDKERITANTIIRSVLASVIDVIGKDNPAHIQNEKELCEWFSKVLHK
jgi:hypothetical protein